MLKKSEEVSVKTKAPGYFLNKRDCVVLTTAISFFYGIWLLNHIKQCFNGVEKWVNALAWIFTLTTSKFKDFYNLNFPRFCEKGAPVIWWVKFPQHVNAPPERHLWAAAFASCELNIDLKSFLNFFLIFSSSHNLLKQFRISCVCETPEAESRAPREANCMLVCSPSWDLFM